MCVFIFVCTSVGLLPPGESPIAVSDDDDDDDDTTPNILLHASVTQLSFKDTVGQIPPEDGANAPKHVGEIMIQLYMLN